VLENLDFIMKDGKVYKSQSAPACSQ